MAEIRDARLITKRTSVPGKIPTGTTGNELNFIKSGELASNLADHSLWGYDGANVFEYGSSSFLGLTGGTVSGNLFVSGNLSATIISATTYYGLPVDVYVTGGTYNYLTGNALFTNNTGGTFTVGGFNSGVTSTLSTGVYIFTGMTTASTSTFNVPPVSALIVDGTTSPLAPTVVSVLYSGGVHTVTSLSSATETYVLLNSGATIFQQTTFPTDIQRRQNVFLGKIGHANKSSIINIFNQPDYIQSPLAQLRDMFEPIGFINGGVYPSPNGANLSFNTSAGEIHGLGIDYTANSLKPNSLSVPGQAPVTFQYRTQTGGSASNTTLIDPTVYDLNGVTTAISGNKATNQRIYLVQNGIFRVQYGQQLYSNLAAAIAGISTESFNTFSNFTDNALLIGVLSVYSNATDLSDPARAQFFFASKFGETIGSAGGFSTTTLQQAYDNSSTPEIITSIVNDGVQFRGGTGNNTDANIFIENNSGVVTGRWNADGGLSATTLSGGTLYSGSTNLYNIFAQPSHVVNNVNAGSNITTGGTATSPTINLAASPSVNNLTFSGTAIGGTVQAGAGRFTSLSATTISGGTLYSGGTNLSSIFSPINLISNPTDDRVLTSLGTTNTANAEANLRFNGSTLRITGTGSTLGENAALHVDAGYALFAQNVFCFSAGTADRYVLAGAVDPPGNFRYAGIRYDRANNVAKFGNYFNSLGEAGYISITSGGTVGIGINNATARFHVNNITTGVTALFEDSSNPDSSPFIIDTNGLVGIGILTPTEKLQVSGNTTISGTLTISGITSGTSETRVLVSDSTGLIKYLDSSTIQGDVTRVQPGSNITTGSTANTPTINLVASPSVNNLTFSGTAIGGNVQVGVGTFTSLSATTISGGTIYSGGTNLYDIFEPKNKSPYETYILTAGTTFNFTGSVNTVSVNKTIGSNTQVNLPSSPITNNFYVVKDRKGDSKSNPITVSGGTYTIDGNTSYQIKANNKPSLTFLFDGQEYIVI
jgi:hypothetical protein